MLAAYLAMPDLSLYESARAAMAAELAEVLEMNARAGKLVADRRRAQKRSSGR